MSRQTQNVYKFTAGCPESRNLRQLDRNFDRRYTNTISTKYGVIDMIPETKRCPRCTETKSKDEYYTKMDKGYLVLQGYCKSCERERRRIKYWENPEKERKRSKKRHFKNGRITTPEADLKHNEHKKAQRLALRVSRANLIIRLCMAEYEVTERDYLNGRHLLGKYEECTTHAIWIVRKYTFLSRDAIAEMFNCATIDVQNRLKTAVKENSWELGDIIFRMKTEHILKKYQQQKPTHWREVELLPYENFSKFFKAPKKNVAYATPASPPVGMTSDKMMEIICWYYNVDWENFVSDIKSRGSMSKARHVYMFLLNKFLGVSQSAIAQLWDKDVDTVSHNIKAGSDYMRGDKGNLYYEMHKRFPGMENQTCPGEVMIS